LSLPMSGRCIPALSHLAERHHGNAVFKQPAMRPLNQPIIAQYTGPDL
jgi:hypothetical protein